MQASFDLAEHEHEVASVPTHGGKTAESKTNPKKRQRTATKERAPARPYRRLPQATLDARVVDMKGRASVMQSKLVLLENRLVQHEREQQHRTNTDSVPAAGAAVV